MAASAAAPAMQGRRRWRGATAVELVVALPVMLLLGLGVLQFAFLYQARLAIEQAVVEAARSGSTGFAQPEALRLGLARGLAPMLFGADDSLDLQASEAKALARVVAGLADGSITLTRHAPSAAAFDDWEEPALDRFGDPIADQTEIPNDSLEFRRTRATPRSGISGYRGDEPVGAASGVTLVDANVLRIELVHGARLSVPFAGRIIAAVLRGWHGCGAGLSAGSGTLCAHLAAAPPRLPLRATASMRMMSPARRSGGASVAPAGGGTADGL